MRVLRGFREVIKAGQVGNRVVILGKREKKNYFDDKRTELIVTDKYLNKEKILVKINSKHFCNSSEDEKFILLMDKGEDDYGILHIISIDDLSVETIKIQFRIVASINVFLNLTPEGDLIIFNNTFGFPNTLEVGCWRRDGEGIFRRIGITSFDGRVHNVEMKGDYAILAKEQSTAVIRIDRDNMPVSFLMYEFYTGYAQDIQFSPDGRYIVVTSLVSDHATPIYIFDMDKIREMTRSGEIPEVNCFLCTKLSSPHKYFGYRSKMPYVISCDEDGVTVKLKNSLSTLLYDYNLKPLVLRRSRHLDISMGDSEYYQVICDVMVPNSSDARSNLKMFMLCCQRRRMIKDVERHIINMSGLRNDRRAFICNEIHDWCRSREGTLIVPGETEYKGAERTYISEDDNKEFSNARDYDEYMKQNAKNDYLVIYDR